MPLGRKGFRILRMSDNPKCATLLNAEFLTLT